MDFAKQTVVAWSRQDSALARRADKAKQVQPGTVQTVNQNGRLITTSPDGSLSFSPTNSNADLATGTSIRSSAGMAFAKVASA